MSDADTIAVNRYVIRLRSDGLYKGSMFAKIEHRAGFHIEAVHNLSDATMFDSSEIAIAILKSQTAFSGEVAYVGKIELYPVQH